MKNGAGKFCTKQDKANLRTVSMGYDYPVTRFNELYNMSRSLTGSLVLGFDRYVFCIFDE